ncbi:hypothetical protein FQA39_LY08633 [Lamprigera yunnana]|nr:hypothetical protein FQA39_LY08633 [Lamprigera yunnana]
MKIKLRQNKSFKCLEKIEQASLRYLYIDISKTLQVFFDMIPENFATSTYLPTRSMLQYILVRLQSIGHLMIRILETSKIAATLINQNINLGHLWKILFVGYGIISRIYALSKIIAEDSCKLYSQLLPFIKNLQDTSFVWLPHNYIFPYNLKSFLNFDWTDENILIENKTLCASGYISLLNSNLESDEEWLDNDLENKTQTQIKIKNQQVVKEDLGILVNNEKRGHSKKSQLVGNIHSLQDLKKYYILETGQNTVLDKKVEDTAAFILFMDQLFDSVNGNNKTCSSSKPLKGGVSQHSDHE